MDMGGMAHEEPQPSPTAQAQADTPMSYFAYGAHSGTIVAHAGLMVLGWCFVLPAGELLSTGHTQLPSQWSTNHLLL